MNTTITDKEGDLKVWWIPQIPGKAFEIPVDSMQEGKKIMDVLADYDAFQFKYNIKPDYANMGGLARCEPDSEKLSELTWYDIDASELCEEWKTLNAETS